MLRSCTDWFTCVSSGAVPGKHRPQPRDWNSLIETSHGRMMLVLEFCLLALLSLLHSAVSSCQKWDVSSQSRDQSLFLYFASGRFSARLSPYVTFLILRYNKVYHLNNQWDLLRIEGHFVSNHLRLGRNTDWTWWLIGSVWTPSPNILIFLPPPYCQVIWSQCNT